MKDGTQDRTGQNRTEDQGKRYIGAEQRQWSLSPRRESDNGRGVEGVGEFLNDEDGEVKMIQLN
jgi:hypothetical protein